MAEVKLSFHAESFKEILDDFSSTLEDMGILVLKPAGEIPERLSELLKSHGNILFKPGEGIPEGLLAALAEEDQEEMIEFLLGNKDACERIMERMEEVLQQRKFILFKPGDGIPDGLLEALLQEDQEELVEFLLENEGALQRIQQGLEERGYTSQGPEKKDSWD